MKGKWIAVGLMVVGIVAGFSLFWAGHTQTNHKGTSSNPYNSSQGYKGQGYYTVNGQTTYISNADQFNNSITYNTTSNVSVETNTMQTTTNIISAQNVTKYIYCIGGENLTPLATFNNYANELTNKTYYATVNGSGIGKWKSTTPYPVPANMVGNRVSQYPTCVTANNYVYCMDSQFSVTTSGENISYGYENNAIFFAQLSSSGIGTWKRTKNYPAAAFLSSEAPTCVVYADVIYCLGGEGDQGFVNDTYYAKLNTTGGINKWEYSANSSPMIGEGFDCLTYQSKIYCIGTDPIENNTYYANLSGQGITQWHTSESTFPIQELFASCIAYDSRIYCIGGSSFQSSQLGNSLDNISYATISSNGLSAWNAAPPYPYYVGGGLSCNISGNYVYCVGGGADVLSADDSPINLTYFAPISETGIGTWRQTTSYPMSISNAACVIS